MLWEIAVVYELETNIMKSHHFMEFPVTPQVLKAWKPPSKHPPQCATVLVNAQTQACVLLLHMKVVDKVDLFHVLPAVGQTQTCIHGAQDDNGVKDSEKENEDVSKLERQNDRRFWVPGDLVDDEREGDETQNHEFSVQNFQDGLEMVVAMVYPMLETMEYGTKNERNDDKEHEKQF